MSNLIFSFTKHGRFLSNHITKDEPTLLVPFTISVSFISWKKKFNQKRKLNTGPSASEGMNNQIKTFSQATMTVFLSNHQFLSNSRCASCYC